MTLARIQMVKSCFNAKCIFCVCENNIWKCFAKKHCFHTKRTFCSKEAPINLLRVVNHLKQSHGRHKSIVVFGFDMATECSLRATIDRQSMQLFPNAHHVVTYFRRNVAVSLKLIFRYSIDLYLTHIRR